MPALIARYGATTSVSTVKSLTADKSWRTSTTTTTSDPAQNNRTLTSLSTADATPDICHRTTYAVGPDPQITALISQQTTVSGTNACTAAATEQNTLSWTRVYYDGKALDQAGAKAEPTSSESVEGFNGTSSNFTVNSTFTYDKYGQVLTVTDPKVTDNAHTGGAVVATSYSAPQAGELPTSLTVTRPAPAGASDQATGRSTVTTLDSARALPKTETDPNNRATNVSYDALGRTTGVWLAYRATGLSPNTAYAYAIPGVVGGKVVPPSTTTTALVGVGTGDTYSSVSSTQIMDGLGRVIQTQSTPAVWAYNTGRILTDTAYDSLGRVIRSNGSWYNNTSAPNTTLYQTTTAQAPNQTHTAYDGLGLPTTTEFVAFGVVQGKTTTAYPGSDRTDVSPPSGSTPISTVTDARGRTAQMWQYKTPTATGNATDADVTTLTYTPAGQPATRKDAAYNTWSYSYDVRGRKVSATDPDTGTTTTRYDSSGRVGSVTDSRSKSTTFAYDLLGRTTATYDGMAADSAKQLTARTYDTVLKGQPSSSTRYVGGATGKAYTKAVLTYDTAYHPTKTTQTIPGSEIGSATPFTYTYQAAYDPVTGLLKADNRSAVGNIASETVNYSYETWGTLQSFGTSGTSYDLSNDYDAYGRSIRTTVNPWGTQIVVTNTYDESTGLPVPVRRQADRRDRRSPADDLRLRRLRPHHGPAQHPRQRSRQDRPAVLQLRLPQPPHHRMVRHRPTRHGSPARRRRKGRLRQHHPHQRRRRTRDEHGWRRHPVLAGLHLRPDRQPQNLHPAQPGQRKHPGRRHDPDVHRSRHRQHRQRKRRAARPHQPGNHGKRQHHRLRHQQLRPGREHHGPVHLRSRHHRPDLEHRRKARHLPADRPDPGHRRQVPRHARGKQRQ
ncbi:hypothetical protein ACFQ0T_00080 [Kitasatospora gansuensis]